MIRVFRRTSTILICLAVVMQPLWGAASRCRCGEGYVPAGLRGEGYVPAGLPFNPSTSVAGPHASPTDSSAAAGRDGCCGPHGTNASDGRLSGDGELDGERDGERAAFGRIDRGCGCGDGDCGCRELERSPATASCSATVCRVSGGEPSLAESRSPWTAIASCGPPRGLSRPDVPIRPASRQVTLCRWLL